MARSAQALAAILVALVTSACATAVPLPRVEKHEVLAVESEASSATLAELDRERNVRYWEIVLTDDEATASFSAEDRAELAQIPIRQAADSMHEVFEENAGVGALVLARLSPSVVRDAAGHSDYETSGELYRLADVAERMQAVVHRRIVDIGSRIASAAGRPDVGFIADPQVGLNAFVPVEFGSNRVYVGTELALSAGSDDELACAIGHEFAHLTEGHTTSGTWTNIGKSTISIAVAVAIAAAAAQGNDGRPLSADQIRGAVMLGDFTSFLLADVPLRLSGWRRGHEREADAVGLYYAWRAGFRPEACAELMMHMAEESAARGGGEGIWWWNVHPVASERVVALRKLAEQARMGTLEYSR